MTADNYTKEMERLATYLQDKVRDWRDGKIGNTTLEMAVVIALSDLEKLERRKINKSKRRK